MTMAISHVREINNWLDEAKIERRKLKQERGDIEQRLWIRNADIGKLMPNQELTSDEWDRLNQRTIEINVEIGRLSERIAQLRGERMDLRLFFIRD
jgi:peptidoglycan hydrolase CwlO-like protein